MQPPFKYGQQTLKCTSDQNRVITLVGDTQILVGRGLSHPRHQMVFQIDTPPLVTSRYSFEVLHFFIHALSILFISLKSWVISTQISPFYALWCRFNNLHT